MGLGIALASALTGASPSQLRRWRRAPTGAGQPALVPEFSAERPVLYSLGDVIALRARVYLREQSSAQQVRKDGEVTVRMSEILGPFVVRRRGIEVPDLFRPRPALTVDPTIRGGRPVVRGTRVPYELVADLVRDGVPPRKVCDFYPSVSADGACDADDFARYVAEVACAS